jgi:diadenosine tetraphosphate (Ap4A) HIT family hydrolase
MSSVIHRRVELARAGNNPYVITKLQSGWLVIGDVQPLPGYCLLLADPVVESVNHLSESDRTIFSSDLFRIGDALMAVLDSYRINYQILGNKEGALHAHIIPRYLTEPEEKRIRPADWGYDWSTARKFDPKGDLPFVEAMRAFLETGKT